MCIDVYMYVGAHLCSYRHVHEYELHASVCIYSLCMHPRSRCLMESYNTTGFDSRLKIFACQALLPVCMSVSMCTDALLSDIVKMQPCVYALFNVCMV